MAMQSGPIVEVGKAVDDLTVDYSATNYTETAATTAGHLAGIDTRLIAGPHVRHIVEGRIDLSSATALIWTAVNGLGIGIFNGTDYQLVTPSSAPTLANNATDLDGAALAVDSVYDLFAQWNSATAFDIVAKKWTNTTTKGYTLYEHQGVKVHENNANGLKRRFLATIYAYNNSATVNFKNENAYRYLSNYYNRKKMMLKAIMSGNSWTRNTDTWARANADDSTLVKWILCDTGMQVEFQGKHNTYTPHASANAETGIGIDSNSTNSAIPVSSGYGTATLLGVPCYYESAALAVGHHYAYVLERGNPTGYTVTFTSYSKGYIFGELFM